MSRKHVVIPASSLAARVEYTDVESGRRSISFMLPSSQTQPSMPYLPVSQRVLQYFAPTIGWTSGASGERNFSAANASMVGAAAPCAGSCDSVQQGAWWSLSRSARRHLCSKTDAGSVDAQREHDHNFNASTL